MTALFVVIRLACTATVLDDLHQIEMNQGEAGEGNHADLLV